MATVNDIVLIYLEDSPVSFARVESILPDHKKNWYQIKLLMLQIPLQVVTWILKDAYINGDDFFMNGKKMRLETVECPGDDTRPPDTKPSSKQGRDQGKIISFSDLKSGRKPGGDTEPDIG